MARMSLALASFLMFRLVCCLLLQEERSGLMGGYIGNPEQTRAQCGGGLGCCDSEAIEVSFLTFAFFLQGLG